MTQDKPQIVSQRWTAFATVTYKGHDYALKAPWCATKDEADAEIQAQIAGLK